MNCRLQAREPASTTRRFLRIGHHRLRQRWRAIRIPTAAFLVAADLAAFGLAFAVVWVLVAPGSLPAWAPEPSQAVPHHLANTLMEFAFLLACLVAFLAGQGRYRTRLRLRDELQQVVLAGLLAAAGHAVLEYALKNDESRTAILGTALLFPLLLVLVRPVTWAGLAAAGLRQLRSLVVGEAYAASRMVEALAAEPRLGYRPVGVVSPTVLDQAAPARSLNRVLQEHRADLLIMAPGVAEAWPQARIEELLRARVPFAIASQTYGVPELGKRDLRLAGHDLSMRLYRSAIARPVARAAKVTVDVLGALSLLAVAAPMLLAIAVAVKLDGGPVFFVHPRIGRGRRYFPCLKFRSMRQDSAEVLEHILRTDPAAAREWAATQKLRNDPRITPIGAFLRRTSLDEVPQLLNVLRLEMSLVGPRPIVASEVHQYGDDFAHYCDVRPGLTGLWQVSGRSDTTYAERVALDMRYVRTWSLRRDLGILLQTIPAVLKRRGAV